MRNFTIEIKGQNFEFKTMNIREWKLFQVYVVVDGIKRRFHMAGDKTGFRITDSFDSIAALENTLSTAIVTEINKTGN
ncbi:hypothetical protein [Foetidibacter luteolus]|uniref:hypothetical protein n=1 Tax=Foetidibacter luteolus TaxID=2608880 RepID=UPI00129A5B0A|nr:hypothetical protein [Foetidibacter luteolus]